ncbi:MAG: T9SS type A sorting domain-containing protein, partial [Bacteroidales bacterium]
LDNNNQLVAESPAYTVPDTTYTTNVCVLASSCLTLNIYDSFGDGILPPGGYEVYLDTVLVDSNFSFDSDMATVYHIGNGCPANDLSVEQVYALGKAPKDGGSPLSVKAIINNWGTAGQTNKNVVLDISGANTYQDTVAISSINSLESDTVTFQNINPASLGTQDISVSVEDDEYNSNNTGHYYQEITANTYNHADTSAIEQGIGFNTGAGMMVAKYHVYGTKSVKAASVNVSGGAAGNQLYGVLLDAKGNILSTGDPVSITAADTNNYVQLPVNPFNVTDQDIYVGFAQMENATNGFFPLNIQTEEPGRPDAFFYVGGLSGGTLTNSADLGRWMLEGVIDAPISDDAMITGISEIKTACTMDSVDLEIGIYNNGMDTISNIEVGYMLNGGVPVTENISSNINPRDTMMHTFSTALDVSSFGYYEIKAFVELAADTIQKNDTTMHDFYNVEPSDIPYSTSFSSSGDNYAWTLIDGNDDGIAPVIDDVGVANTGTNVVSVLGGEGKQDEYVISRCLNLKAGKSYELSYYHRVGDFLGTPIPEDMHIVMGTSPEPAALTTLIADPPAVDAIDFVPMAHDFNVAQDGVYYIAFNITTDSPWIYLLDDVAVTDVSSIEQQAENRINIYPNPANDILNIVGDGLVIEQIQVYNTMGQLMFATSVNDNNARLNVHEYTPGMYFVQMQTEQGTITRKVQVK